MTKVNLGTLRDVLANPALWSIPVDTPGQGPGKVMLPTLLGGINAGPSLLSSTVGIDGKTVANTALYAIPAGKTLIATGYVVRPTSISAITVGPTLGLGNISGTSNIFAAGASGITTTTSIYGNALNSTSLLTVAAGVVYLNVTVAATGTTLIMTADLIGYLV